jgi:hypothetical protein
MSDYQNQMDASFLWVRANGLFSHPEHKQAAADARNKQWFKEDLFVRYKVISLD